MSAAEPWLDEPDEVDWIDPETGYACAIRRHPEFGSLLGYVGVPESHPWYEMEQSDLVAPPAGYLAVHNTAWAEAGGRYEIASLLPAHGGVNFSSHRTYAGLETHGADWWFGFDCAHAFDLAPGLVALQAKMRRTNPLFARIDSILARLGGERMKDTYRDIPYVCEQCTQLAEALKLLADETEKIMPARVTPAPLGNDQHANDSLPPPSV